MVRSSWSCLGLLCLALACGRGGDAPEATATGPATGTDAAAVAERSDAFPGCPEGTSPTELEIAAVETKLRWCVRRDASGKQIQEGPWERRLEGRLAERGSYVDGERHGTWTAYWLSGKPQSEGSYDRGRRAGMWTFWREDGSEIQRTDYGAEPEDLQIAWEPDAEDAVAETAAAEPPVTLRFENAREGEMIVAIEPVAEEWAVPPGTSVELTARGEGAADLIVEATDDGIVIWAGEDTVSYSGDEEPPPLPEAEPPSEPIPAEQAP